MSCVWTFGRYLEAAPLAAPAPCIAAIFLLGGWVGALASANLNCCYLSCGASAGVAALLGAVWADQLLNARKYANHGWTALVLALVTAVFVVASLLPMLDVWYMSAALLTGELILSWMAPWGCWPRVGWVCGCACCPSSTMQRRIAAPATPSHLSLTPTTTPLHTPGFFAGAALLLIPVPGQRRRAGGPCRWLALQALCAALVIGGAAAGAVGLALHADLGSKSSFLKDGSCVDFGVWNCLPAGASPNGCFVEAHPDGSGPPTLYCPSGEPVPLKNIQLPAGDTDALTAVCYQQCTAGASAANSPSPAPSSPPSPPPSRGGNAPAAGGTADSSQAGGSSAPSAPSSPSSEPGGGGELFVRRRR